MSEATNNSKENKNNVDITPKSITPADPVKDTSSSEPTAELWRAIARDSEKIFRGSRDDNESASEQE